MNRRQLLKAMGAAPIAVALPTFANVTEHYDYLELTIEYSPLPHSVGQGAEITGRTFTILKDGPVHVMRSKVSFALSSHSIDDEINYMQNQCVKEIGYLPKKLVIHTTIHGVTDTVDIHNVDIDSLKKYDVY
jgi:hypothetical protein